MPEEDVGEPTDAPLERVKVDGLALRVVRWEPGADGPGAASSSPADGPGAASSSPADGPGVPSAAPFLLVHGLASNARLWDGVGRRLSAEGRRSVAVDLRGHGRSDKPDDGYGFATISGDLRALIDALHLDRPILAGQSWGAGVVLDFAVRYPDSTTGIVLVDGGLNDLRDSFPSWDACWQRLAPPQLVGLPLSDVQGYFDINHADWPREGIQGSLANFEIRPDGTIAPWLTRERHKAILRAMWDQRTGDLWARLRVPALVVPVDGGEGDWTKAKRAGLAAAESAGRASGTPVQVRWFQGDHDIHAQHPVQVAEAILEAERNGLFEPVPASGGPR
jgi:pimeloyl-ACP methyl ester carboxylesterase